VGYKGMMEGNMMEEPNELQTNKHSRTVAAVHSTSISTTSFISIRNSIVQGFGCT
jgi:hypothetical protein